MRWSKIKNIIILLLLIVNVCLLAMVGLRAGRTAYNQRQTQEKTVKILEQNGIAFQPEHLPGDMTLTGQRLTQAAPTQAEAEALVGAVTQTAAVGSTVTYTGEKGVAAISASGNVDAQL